MARASVWNPRHRKTPLIALAVVALVGCGGSSLTGNDGPTSDAATDEPRDTGQETPDTPLPEQSCADLFAEVPGFELCAETANTCSFNAQKDQARSCADVCEASARDCLGGYNNGNDQVCVAADPVVCGVSDHENDICVCARCEGCAPQCGDGACEPTEGCASCETDCGACPDDPPPPPPDGFMLIEDDFESGALDDGWNRECDHPYECTVVDNPAGAGKVARFEWRRSDYSSSDSQSKRAEITTRKITWDENEVWVGFRAFFSSETMAADGRPCIITQWHGSPDFDLGEDWRNPTTAMSIRNGTLSYVWRGDYRPVTSYDNSMPCQASTSYPDCGELDVGPVVMDAWNVFIYHFVFDYTNTDGLVEMWVNGAHLEEQGIRLGFNDAQGPYWKFGGYYWNSSDHPERVLYFDDVKIFVGQNGFDAVSPE